MVVFLDNEIFLGWYFFLDGDVFGDGTKERAEKIKRNYIMGGNLRVC